MVMQTKGVSSFVLVDEQYRDSFMEIEQIIENDEVNLFFDYIGEGDTSKVYGYNGVAVKVYCDYYGDPHDLAAIFENELAMMKELQECPYTPKLLAYKEKSYIVMEYIEGFDLESYIYHHSTNEQSEKVLQEQTSRQLEHFKLICKLKGIAPKDLHDNNILVKDDGTLYVIDFGMYEKVACVDSLSDGIITNA